MQPTPVPIQAAADSRRAHLTHIDFLRIFAIFLVILNHTCIYFMPTDAQGTIKSCLLFFSNQIIKTGVPIFFMISGALLLPREESYSQLFRKRILRFLGVIIIFWALQLSADALINGTNLSLGLFLQSCYTCNYVPLQAWTRWFLYAYLAVLLLLPMLRLLARRMKDRDFIYLFGLQFIIMAFVPTVICLIERSDSSLPGKLASYLPFHPAFGAGLCAFYMLMGYFLEHRIRPVSLASYTGGGYQHLFRRLILLSLVCLLIGTSMMAYCRSLRPDLFLPQSTIFLTCYIPLPCATLYLLARAFFLRVSVPPSVQRLLKVAAGGILTVMLTENLFRYACTPIFEYLLPYYGGWLSSLPTVVLTFLGSLSLGILLKKLPFLRRIL